MAGDLPERHLCWRLEQDHENKDLFFLGTEYGLFCSVNAGESWLKMSAGAPNIPFRDLAIQRRENDLVGATFGRGFYVLDDYTPLRELNDELLKDEELYIFPVRKALWYHEADKLGGTKGSQGDSFFQTPNPDFGAMLTYYVRDETKTLKATRQEKEAKIKKAGGDVPTPSWDEVRQEELEQAPKIYFEISDQAGQVVSRVNGSTSKGIHRVNWNLRHASGPMIAPGDYSAQAFKSFGGEIKEIGNAQPISVVSIVEPSIEGQDINETIEYQLELSQFRSSIQAVSSSLATSIEGMTEIKQAIERSSNGTPELMKQARELELSLIAADHLLNGNPVVGNKFEQGVPSIARRVSSVLFGSMGNSYGITQTQREQIEIARGEFSEVGKEIKNLLEVDVKVFEEQLSEAGIPWTTGRAIPDID